MNKIHFAPLLRGEILIFRKYVIIFMKIFLLTLVFGLTSAFANTTFAQKIDINKTNVPIEELFNDIQKKSEYVFFYNDEILQRNYKISVQLTGASIEEILNIAFGKYPLEYSINERQVVVKEKAPEAVIEQTATKTKAVQKITISGTVKDKSGMPLLGANIIEKGTSNGTSTDFDGNFTLDVNPGATLHISYVGFVPQEVAVGNQTVFNIALEEDAAALEEVVVVGYGVQRKSDLTGAVAQVKSEDLENRTVINTQQALQGKAAGVQVVQTSGAPGATASIRIRGYSSNSGSDPLFVVDGLRTQDIGAIDPNNIESIEILKDAASAAIYGAQAGNGVVLITTKKGKSGIGKMDYSFQYAVNELSNVPDVMNAEQYINYMTEGNIIPESELDNLYDGVTDTDWVDVAFETSLMQKHNLGFQNGNDKGSYYLALSYLDQDGIVKGDSDVYTRVTGMINGDYKINDWLRVGTTNTIEKWESKFVSENSEYGSLLAAVMTMDPLTPNLYSPDEIPAFMQNLLDNGKVLLTNKNGDYYGISQIFESEQVHPGIMRDNSKNKNDGGNILGTMFADIMPFKGFTFTSKLGYRGGFTNNYSFGDIYYANAVTYRDKINLSRTTSNNIYYQWENFMNYMFNIKDHNFTAMLGTSYQHNEITSVNGGADEITRNDPAYWDLDFITDSATRTVGGNSFYTRQMSYFGRLSYNYLEKYLFQASVRRDASDTSFLPESNRWGTFPSFSAGYVITKEEFFPEIKHLDFFKIRASWGQNGSTGPLGNFAYRAAIGSSSSYPFSNALIYQVASSPSTLNNEDLTWETSEQLDIGFDIRAFNSRLTISYDYFQKKTEDLLVAITPPYETGVGSTVVNAGNVNNDGIEIEVGWNDRIGEDFSYGIRGNLATLNNKVTYLDPSISRISGASYHTNQGITAFEEGYPVWYFRGYELEDIDDATGDPIFRDQLTIDTDGDGKPDTADGIINDDDKTNIGSAIPDFTYGITLTASFKGFDFTVFGAGSEGNDIFNALTRTDRPRGNKLTTFYNDRWTPDNTDASRPRPNANGEDKYWISDAAIFDGSYFKIKQIQLGYSLPKSLLDKTFISNCRFYGSLEDWFVFTKYPGMDPEASAGAVSSLGVDKGAYPISRKAVLGVNITF